MKSRFCFRFVSLFLLSSFTVSFAAGEPRWVQLPAWKAGVNGPSDREHSLFFIAPNRPDEAILYGGLDYSNPQLALTDLWALNLKNGKWRKLNQQGTSPGPSARLAISGTRKEILVTGGHSSQGTPSASAVSFSLERNVGKWEKVSNPLTIPRSLHSLEAIPGTPFFLSFGGIGLDETGSQTYSSETSLVELGRAGGGKILKEVRVASGSAPSGRYGFVSAFDVRHMRLIVAVGQGPISFNSAGEMISEQDDKTFALYVKEDGTLQWEELRSAQLEPRRNPCWALDRNRNHLYVWGGTADGLVSLQSLSRLNLNDKDPRWESVTVAGSSKVPKARSSCVAVYDEHRDRILFGFGNNLNEEKTAIAPETNIWALELRSLGFEQGSK